VIVAGGTRCGSTSLFRYLSDHPGVCPSSRKETRFFLDQEYPGRSDFRYEQGMEAYWSYFDEVGPECTHLLDATPDYLYAPGVPDRIRTMVGSPEIVFLLREPVARFLSWYRFAGQNGMIPADMKFGRFLSEQGPDCGSAPQHLRVLEQGLYPRYISRFLEHFPKDQLHFLWFEELVEDPHGVLRNLAGRIGLPSDFYDTYEFGRENPSLEVRWPRLNRYYQDLLFVVRARLHSRRRLRGIVRKIARPLVKPVYDSVMVRSRGGAAGKGVEEDQHDTLEALRDYYSGVEVELTTLLGERPPWALRSRSLS
jgi:hypothetical protein